MARFSKSAISSLINQLTKMLSEVGENTVACIEWGKMESCSRMYYGR